ncbi:TP53-regulated inhibitor of apoptosis 1 [Mactra antiquata]
MQSVGAECQELKNAYDKCFNDWFTNSFLKGKKGDPCQEIFKSYQSCVKKAIAEKNIDLWEIDKNVLGTSEERTPPK